MTDSSQDETHILLIGCPDIREIFRKLGFDSRKCLSLQSAIKKKMLARARVIILYRERETDGNFPNHITAIRKQAPFTDVIVWAPNASGRFTRDVLKAGARDVYLKRSQTDLMNMMRDILQTQKILPNLLKLNKAQKRGHSFQGIISLSPSMWDLFEQCSRIAPTDASVVIQGETGTGKDLLARAIHRLSDRNGRYIPVNCSAIPSSLIDSELFGHKKGSFTGAVQDKQGYFQSAHEGTLLLDEIGDIPESVQLRLLRALQNGTVRPVGAQRDTSVDVRIIAASHVPLEEAVNQGSFREDLFFRLNVIRLIIPPLRDRPNDILHLFGHFVKNFSKSKQMKVSLTDNFINLLMQYDWPGNVRQLENFCQRLVVLYPKEKLGSRHFRQLMKSYKDKRLSDKKTEITTRPFFSPSPSTHVDINKPLTESTDTLVSNFEENYLKACLKKNNGKIEATAKQAGISRRTLLRKLKQYKINKKLFKKTD